MGTSYYAKLLTAKKIKLLKLQDYNMQQRYMLKGEEVKDPHINIAELI